MNHLIVSNSRLHSWEWLVKHSYSVPVEKIKSMGFGSIAILPYHFEQNGVRNYDRKKVVINSGSQCRILNYTKDYDKAGCPDLTGNTK